MKLKRVFSCGTSWKSRGASYFDLFIDNNIAILGSGNHNIESFRKLQSGDLVAAKSGHYLLAIAEIISDEAEYWLWKDYITNDEINKYQVPPEADIDIVYVKKWFKLEEHIYYPTPSGTGFVQNDRSDYLTQCNEAYYKELKKMEKEEIINILKQKKQIILQGAPGTGKTYSTAEIAVNLIDGNISDDRKKVMERYKELIKKNQIFFTTFHQSMDYEEFVEGYKPVSDDGNIYYEIKDGIFKEACNKSKEIQEVGKVGFEEAWNNFTDELYNGKAKGINKNTGYLELETLEDKEKFSLFIDNNIVKCRPEKSKTGNLYNLNNGVKQLYYSLKKNITSKSYVKSLLEYLKDKYNLADIDEINKNPVVLIIDEINRGNIAKIFGELITLLEADKRKNADNEIEVKLPYSKEIFSVPSNLYIIGTMNTTDRSIGYIDYALRRRFAFITIKADKEKIESFYNEKNSDCKDKALKLFSDVEKIIENNLNEEFDSDDIMIGHSYFMAENEEELKRKLEYEIKPLLFEYYKDGILKNDSSVKKAIKELAI